MLMLWWATRLMYNTSDGSAAVAISDGISTGNISFCTATASVVLLYSFIFILV